MGDESLRGEPVGVDRRRKKKDVGEIGRRFRCGEKKRQECANFRTFFYQGGKKKRALKREPPNTPATPNM
jgi:hypothetical protein